MPVEGLQGIQYGEVRNTPLKSVKQKKPIEKKS